MKRILGFILTLMLLMSIGYSAPAPPVLVSGEIVGYNVAGIDVIIKNTRTGFTTTIPTNHFGEFHYEYLDDLNCGDSIYTTVLGITETGSTVCNINGDVDGYINSRTGLWFIQFDFSGSCPTCNCLRCDSCCPSCECGSGGGSVIVQDCSEEKCAELFPCEECPVCEECVPCEQCQDCPNLDDYCPEYQDCEVCVECPPCDSGLIGTIIAIILSLVAGAGIGLSVYKDKYGKLKFSIRSHRHTGRNYLHSIYRVHRSPYTHEHGEVMPKYELLDGYWRYVPINER